MADTVQALLDLVEMRKTDCIGETRVVPHVPHALESEFITIIVVITVQAAP